MDCVTIYTSCNEGTDYDSTYSPMTIDKIIDNSKFSFQARLVRGTGEQANFMSGNFSGGFVFIADLVNMTNATKDHLEELQTTSNDEEIQSRHNTTRLKRRQAELKVEIPLAKRLIPDLKAKVRSTRLANIVGTTIPVAQ